MRPESSEWFYSTCHWLRSTVVIQQPCGMISKVEAASLICLMPWLKWLKGETQLHQLTAVSIPDHSSMVWSRQGGRTPHVSRNMFLDRLSQETGSGSFLFLEAQIHKIAGFLFCHILFIREVHSDSRERNKSPTSSSFFFFLTSLLEYSCFTMLH